MERFTIIQTAMVAPEKIVTNDDLAQIMDTSDDWIYSRTGIHRRHIVTDENTSDLAIEVAEKLLQRSGLDAKELDFILVATMSPDSMTPSTAALVQGAIGATHAFAMDLGAACSGFVYGMSLASSLLQTRYQTGILIGAEVLSKLVDWNDRSTAVLFGDGASGVLLHRTTEDRGLIAEDLKTFGDRSEFLTAGTLLNENKFSGIINEASPYFAMNGREVYNFATREVPATLSAALDKASLSADDIDVYILHQANARIVKSIAKRFGQPMEKFPLNMAEYGNTSAASIGILLDDLWQKGQIKAGQTIALAGFGGGLTVGTLIVKL